MTPTDPLVSVILPVHEGVPVGYYRLAVESILQQQYTRLELLIMLDGVHKEDLLDYSATVAAEDQRIRILRHETGRGIAASLNALIQQAQGEFIARMDADDVCLPDRIQRQVRFLQDNPTVSLVGTFADEIDESGAAVFTKVLPTEHDALVRFMSRRDPFIHPTVLFRRTFFDHVGLYDPRPDVNYCEDTELWLRAFQAQQRTSNIPMVLYHFRVTPQTYTSGRRRGLRYGLCELRLRYRHVVEMRLPWYFRLLPLGVLAARLSPAFVLRFLYRTLR